MDSPDSLPLGAPGEHAIGPPAFNPGFGLPAPPNVTTNLEIAQAALQGLAGQIRSHVTNGVAQAAVTTDLLANKLQVPIQTTLGNAAQTLIKLQQPIATSLAGDLGSSLEQVLPLGVVPPSPETIGTMPAAVQVRTAAVAGDLGPALEQYRLTAAPYAGFGGTQYAKAMQTIQASLPHDDATQVAFAAAVQNIQSQVVPAAITTQGVVFPPVPTGPTLSNPSTPPVVSPYGKWQQCVVTANDVYANRLDSIEVQRLSDPQLYASNYAIYTQQYNDQIAACGPQPPPDMPGQVPPPIAVPAPPVSPQPPPGRPTPAPVPSTPPVAPPPVVPPLPPGTPLPPPGSPVVPPATGGGGAVPLPSSPLPPQQPTGGAAPGIPGSNIPLPPQPQPNVPMPPNPVPAPAPPRQPNPSTITPGGITTCPPGSYPQDDGSCATTPPEGFQPPTPPYTPPTLSASDIAAGCKIDPPPPAPSYICPTGSSLPPKSPTPTTVEPTTPKPVTPPAEATPPKPKVDFEVGMEQVQGCDQFPPLPGVTNYKDFTRLSEMLGLRNSDGSINTGTVNGDLTGIVGGAITAIAQLGDNIIDALGTTVQSIVQTSNCVNPEYIGLLMADNVCGFINKYFATDLGFITIPNQQSRNYMCPTLLPSAADSAIAWMGGQIDAATLECWVRAANQRYPEYKKVIDGMRTKFPVFSIGSLYLRGELSDQQFKDRVRELGYTQDTDVSDLKELLKVIPPPSDLVRFMVRDVADAKLVEQFGMDDNFDDKFAGDIKDWAKSSGVSDDYMKNVWRAHWSIPAPGQLFDMLHRSATLDADSEAYTSIDDVETALKQQDILPYWIPKLLETSYRLIGRIDIRQAYRTGSFSADDVEQQYERQGYSPEDAKRMAKITTDQITVMYTRHPVVTQFANGWLSDDDFTTLLSDEGATEATIAKARKRGFLLAEEKKRKRCTEAYRKRFVIGDLSTSDARANLLAMGLPADLVDTIINGWACERDSRGKAIPAGELATLYSQGAIDAPGLTSRLQRLGYSYEDSVLLARKVVAINQQKVSKAEAEQLKQQEKNAAQQALADQRAADQEVAATQKATNKAQSMLRVTALRNKRIIAAGEKWGLHSGVDLPTAVAQLQGLYRNLIAAGLWLPDEVIAAITTATGDKGITTFDVLSNVVQAVLQA